MNKPSASWHRIGEDIRGPLISVRYSGVYPPGSDGNAFAEAMVQFFRSVLVETRPAAVIFDLIGLDYTYGDAIGGLAVPLIHGGTCFLPAAIVATGSTARALAPLLEPSFVLGVASIKLFRTKEEALRHLEQELDRS